MKIVCIFGQLAVAKDTVADNLAKVLNERQKTGYWDRTAFANPVKQVYQDAFCVDRNFIEKWKRSEECPPGMSMTVRKGLQFIGDGFREIKSDIWIERALRETNKQLIISDGRYTSNEAKAIDYRGGINVLLYRPGYLNDDPNQSEAQVRPLVDWCIKNMKTDGPIKYDPDRTDIPRHLEFFDYYLVNDGTIQQLYDKVLNLLVPFVENKYV
jgi:hypothetical protein